MAVLHIVKVRNVGPYEFDIPHRGEVATIPPGGEAVVTWDAATSMFGDPTIMNTPTNPARSDRYEQVRAMHNFHRGFDTETEAIRLRMGDIGADKSSWEAKRPKIEVSTVDTNEPITMLIDDPTGKATNPEIVSGLTQLDVSNAAQVNATIAEMQDQISRLTSVLAVLDPKVVASALAPDLSDDGPVASTFDPANTAVSDWAHEQVHGDVKVPISEPVAIATDDGPTGPAVITIPKARR